MLTPAPHRPSDPALARRHRLRPQPAHLTRLKSPGRIFANPTAGPRSVSIEDLTALFPGHEVEAIEPSELAARVKDTACAGGPVSFVGVAGGDGTVRCAAETLVQLGSDLPLLVIPAGTRNHFAGDLGMADLEAAAAAASDGVVRSVDLGCVNHSIFVNNSSLGTYPNLVIEREEHERHLPKRLATVVAAWHQMRKGHRIVVDVDGVSRRVWAVFVGNNCYGETLRDLTGRDRLDEGVLDVRLARANGRMSRCGSRVPCCSVGCAGHR